MRYWACIFINVDYSKYGIVWELKSIIEAWWFTRNRFSIVEMLAWYGALKWQLPDFACKVSCLEHSDAVLEPVTVANLAAQTKAVPVFIWVIKMDAFCLTSNFPVTAKVIHLAAWCCCTALKFWNHILQIFIQPSQ